MTAPFFLPSSIASFAVVAIPSPLGSNPRAAAGAARATSRATVQTVQCPGGDRPRFRSDRFFGALAGSNPDRFFDRAHEDLAVTDAAGLGALLDGIDHLLCLTVGHDDL